MAPPFDWFRASLPFTRFHGQLYRSPPSLARALFDCFLLVCALEAMRLYYFYTVHEKVFVSELAPDTMAAQTLAAWPDGLVATLSRPHAFNMPARLSVNRPLPILLILPRWTSSAANVVLSFMLRPISKPTEELESGDHHWGTSIAPRSLSRRRACTSSLWTTMASGRRSQIC